MGKGDRKTKKGKIAMGSFGVRRPKKPTAVNEISADKVKGTAKEKKAPEAKKTASPKKKTEKADK